MKNRKFDIITAYILGVGTACDLTTAAPFPLQGVWRPCVEDGASYRPLPVSLEHKAPYNIYIYTYVCKYLCIYNFSGSLRYPALYVIIQGIQDYNIGNHPYKRPENSVPITCLTLKKPSLYTPPPPRASIEHQMEKNMITQMATGIGRGMEHRVYALLTLGQHRMRQRKWEYYDDRGYGLL